MSSVELSRLSKAAESLSQSEQLSLAAKLIELAMPKETNGDDAPSDLSEFYGTVHFDQDGVEYQRRLRDEWP
jgi:hypothetical protein